MVPGRKTICRFPSLFRISARIRGHCGESPSAMILRARLTSRLAAVVAVGLVATLVGPVSPAPAATPVAPVASSWSGSSSSRASITLSRPPGTGAGHVMVASIVAQDDERFSAPAGWAVVRDDAIPDTLRQTVYVKVAGPSEPASYTWTLPEWRRVAGGITTYSGVDTTQPVDTSAASTATTAGTAVTAPSITTSVAGGHARPPRRGQCRRGAHGAGRHDRAMGSGIPQRHQHERRSGVVVRRRPGHRRPHGAPDRHGQPRPGRASAPSSPSARRVRLRLRRLRRLRPPPPPPPPPSGDPVLVGAGDIATCAGTGDEATAALLDGIPGTVFTLGDNAYIDGTAAEYANCYEPNWGRHKARTAIAVAGNHDYNTPGATPYYNYFGAAAGDPAKGYYATTVGAWQVIVLNSNCDKLDGGYPKGSGGGCAVGSPQEQWLRATLAASTAQCTLALWHHPGFSSATVHRSDPVYQPVLAGAVRPRRRSRPRRQRPRLRTVRLPEPRRRRRRRVRPAAVHGRDRRPQQPVVQDSAAQQRGPQRRHLRRPQADPPRRQLRLEVRPRGGQDVHRLRDQRLPRRPAPPPPPPRRLRRPPPPPLRPRPDQPGADRRRAVRRARGPASPWPARRDVGRSRDGGVDR